jgi:DNA-binding CsgD family transcriptional regulator
MAATSPAAKSDLLRWQDVRDAYRLIGDCRDVGSDPALWQPRMLEGLARMFGVPEASGGEGRWAPPEEPIQVASLYWSSDSPRAREVYTAYWRAGGATNDPLFQAVQRHSGRVVTRTRRQLLPDGAWYRSESFEYRRLIGVDHNLVSVYHVGDGTVGVVCLLRSLGERDFGPREQRRLGFFHRELGRLIGRALVSDGEPSPEGLPPRLRQTLACLLEGDGEKQVAARLGLAQATVHQYVTALYRRFGVKSRAQLLAHALRRSALPSWRRLAVEEPEAPRPTTPTASDTGRSSRSR